VFSYVLFTFFTRNIDPLRPYVKPADGLKVDVFIPTYNEDLDIVEATMIGCGKITYPHTTFVLDDGSRPQVKELAVRLGCEYITRPTHEHAKAGNIKRPAAPLVIYRDAGRDMVPQPGYLDRTLGYFEMKNWR
jgi:cellulose synthase (UDP-forming)